MYPVYDLRLLHEDHILICPWKNYKYLRSKTDKKILSIRCLHVTVYRKNSAEWFNRWDINLVARRSLTVRIAALNFQDPSLYSHGDTLLVRATCWSNSDGQVTFVTLRDITREQAVSFYSPAFLCVFMHRYSCTSPIHLGQRQSSSSIIHSLESYLINP